jgi:hypothetical protein
MSGWRTTPSTFRGQPPFVGLPATIDGDVRTFPAEQRYITEEVGDDASRGALSIASDLDALSLRDYAATVVPR